jgi:pyrroloquinoline-quinone synthase
LNIRLELDMNVLEQIQQRIAQHDLLQHPFYQAWSAGQLSADDLRDYASDYYHHVAAFPTYLSALHSRLPDGEARRAVLRNLCDEEIEGVAHSDLWLDFAESMGADREAVRSGPPSPAIASLIAEFRSLIKDGTPAEALAALYAYESQVPRIARQKADGLRKFYQADSKACRYFNLHQTADVEHAQVWREQIESSVAADRDAAGPALQAAGRAAVALWRALDGIEDRRKKNRAA